MKFEQTDDPLIDHDYIHMAICLNWFSNLTLKTFVEYGRVVEFRDVFELTDQKVNSVVTKPTITMSGLQKYPVKMIS